MTYSLQAKKPGAENWVTVFSTAGGRRMTNFEKLKGILSDIKISGVKLFGRIETINDAGYILSSCIRCSDCPVYGDCRY